MDIFITQKGLFIQKARQFYLSKALLWSLVCIGILLHFSQYVFNRSLWVDEALVAIKIIESSYTKFFQSSETPLGFLIVEKFLVQLFGESEYIFRLFPFLSAVLAIILFLKVAPDYIAPTAVPLALGLFAISGRLIYHSSALKQYSSDVLLTLFLYFAAKKFLSTRIDLKQTLKFGLIGSVAIWFSHPAVFILAAIGGYLTLTQFKSKDWQGIQRFAIVYLFWFISFGIFYAIALRGATSTEEGQQFWSEHFMPFPPSLVSDLIWFVRTFFEMIEYALEYPKPLFRIGDVFQKILASITGLSPSIGASFAQIATLLFSGMTWIMMYALAAVMMIAGCISIFLRDKGKFFLLIVPIFLTLLASGLRKYPFANRLILFLLPHLFLFLGEGAIWLKGKTKPLIGLVLILAFLFVPISSAVNGLIHPRTHEEARPVMRYLQDNIQEGDVVYVYYGSQVVFKYYQRLLNLQLEKTVQGISSRENWQKYIEDIQQLRGHERVWLFFSHAYSEEAFFLYYLDSIGKRLDEFKDERASAYLYDLS